MENIEEIQLGEQVTTLETEVNEFVTGLPYWAKYLCAEILSGKEITEGIIDTSYSYLLQDLKLAETTKNPQISITFNPSAYGDYKEKIVFESLKNVQGVNALVENQTIEFSTNLTIIFGANGSGKSGYARLLKNSFYSKDKETILENVNLESGHKPVYAEFNFSSEGIPISLKYPEDSENGIFNQFAVFDGEVGKKHLTNRNDFSFRPAGLNLFSEFNAALEKLQAKLISDIQLRPIHNPFAADDIFQGESEIKTFLTKLSHSSNLEELKKHLPFTDDDKTKKAEKEKAYDDLKIDLSQKDKSLKALRNIKLQLADRKKNLETINQYFNQKYLNIVRASITDCNTKQETAKKEGVTKFQTDKIKNVGTLEWKQFIEAAEKFALIQKEEGKVYPEIGDNCLLCQQPINDETSSNLIKSYWEYIKSVAEQEAKTALEGLGKIKIGFEELNLNQFPETDTLTVWLQDNHRETLETIKQTLSNQVTLRTNIVNDLTEKTTSERTAVQIDLTLIDSIDADIDTKIKAFEEDEQNKTLVKLLTEKTYLAHKEKLSQRISDIEKLHQNMVWVNKANQLNKQRWKKHSTDTEKRLSGKYFNDEYLRTFNDECIALNGNFGIEIDAKSSEGQSNRQLFLKGRTPSAILSEGEQKVIALADFIAETNLSTINKGVIFDDPVNSLDEERKSNIAERLVALSKVKQVVIFTHDLVFLNALINYCQDYSQEALCHWVEKMDNVPGYVALKNSPSLESDYKKSGEAQRWRDDAKSQQGSERERSVKYGFTALRTNYEALVMFKIFNGAVERFNERISIDRLKEMVIDKAVIDEVIDSYSLCCRYMEGHLHSNRYAAKKPTLEALIEEIDRFDTLNSKIAKLIKENKKK